MRGALLLALLLGADAPDPPLEVAPPPQIPERARVLKALEAFFAATPDNDINREQVRLVLDFAEASPEVNIFFEPRYTQFLLEGGPESLTSNLLAFYVAGAVQFDLTHPDQRDDRLADVVPALQLVLRRYDQIRALTTRYRSPFLEKVAAEQARGTLREFVASLPEQPAAEPAPQE